MFSLFPSFFTHILFCKFYFCITQEFMFAEGKRLEISEAVGGQKESKNHL